MKQHCVTHVIRQYFGDLDREEAEQIAEENIELIMSEIHRHPDVEEATCERHEDLDTGGYGNGFSVVEADEYDE